MLNKKYCPKQKQLVLALAAALTGLAAPAAWATDCGSGISSPVTGQVDWTAGDCQVSSSGSITGAQLGLNIPQYTTLGMPTNIGTLTNSGGIYGTVWGVNNLGTLGHLVNDGIISSVVNGVSNGGGVLNAVTIDAFDNTGTISGIYAVDNMDMGHIGTLNNSGSIISTGNPGAPMGSAIWNEFGASIDTLTNSNTISGEVFGILNQGSITTLTNTSTGRIFNGTDTGLGQYGVDNSGSIGTLNNSGQIGNAPHGAAGQLGQVGVRNGGSIGTLINGGTIGDGTGAGTGQSGIYNYGSIGTLTNNGTISGGMNGIYVVGTCTGTGNCPNSIGVLNNTGTITSARLAIVLDPGAKIGVINNSGVIAGEIDNSTSNPLVINGGTGTTFGTLTGYGGVVGLIDNRSADVTFGSGNLALNDNINVGRQTVNNTGTAVLQVAQPLTITGNYAQGANATLQIVVGAGATTQGDAGDSGYGRLVVSRNTTIDAGSSISLKSGGYAFAGGQRYVVVDTARTATYNANSLRYSAVGYGGAVTGTEVTSGARTLLVLSVAAAPPVTTPPVTTPPDTTPPDTPPADTPPTDTAPPSTPPAGNPPPPTASIPPGLSSNAYNSLHGLLSYTGIESPDLLNLYNAALGSLNQGSTGGAERIGKQLGAIQTGWAPAAPIFATLNRVAAWINTLRLGDAAGVGQTGIATGEGPARNGVWGQAFGGHASQDERDDIDGYSANYGGLLIGADRALNEHWRVGGAFSYSNTQIDNTGATSGDKTRVNSYGLIGYASYDGRPWYVNLSGGVVQQRYDTTRRIDFQGFSGTADGDFNGQQYVARIEAGYPLALGSSGYTLTPSASLTYAHLDQDSYTEDGGNGAALSVGSTHANSVRSGLGAKLAKSYSTRYGDIVPELQLHWIHEYDHARQATGASYAADPSGQTAFTTVGATPVSDLAALSLGVTLLRANNLSLSARYEVQAGGGFLSQTGSLNLRQLF